MAKEQLPVVAELVNVDVTLDKDDVAAILMSRAEERLKNELKAFKLRETELTAARKTLEKTLETALATAAANHFESAKEALTAAARALKVKEIRAETHARSFNPPVEKFKGGISCGLSISGERPRIRWSVEQETRIPAAVLKAHEALKAHDKVFETHRTEWMEARRKLADLPTLERRARAVIAEQRLAKTPEGQDLIDALDGMLDSSIRLLGDS